MLKTLNYKMKNHDIGAVLPLPSLLNGMIQSFPPLGLPLVSSP